MDFKPIFCYDVKFVVDEEHKAVVAMLDAPDEDTYEDVAGFGCMRAYSVVVCRDLFQQHYQINRTRGVALCTEGDTFDVEIGKKIAYAKLYQKVHVSMAKRIQRIYEHVWKAAQGMYDDVEDDDKHIVETPMVDQIISGEADEWFKSL